MYVLILILSSRTDFYSPNVNTWRYVGSLLVNEESIAQSAACENTRRRRRDFSKGSIWNFESLLNRAIGRPKETIQTQNEKIQVVFVEGKTIL
jgi:hypothetical protein